MPWLGTTTLLACDAHNQRTVVRLCDILHARTADELVDSKASEYIRRLSTASSARLHSDALYIPYFHHELCDFPYVNFRAVLLPDYCKIDSL